VKKVIYLIKVNYSSHEIKCSVDLDFKDYNIVTTERLVDVLSSSLTKHTACGEVCINNYIDGEYFILSRNVVAFIIPSETISDLGLR
jgi:hypothetical protein